MARLTLVSCWREVMVRGVLWNVDAAMRVFAVFAADGNEAIVLCAVDGVCDWIV